MKLERVTEKGVGFCNDCYAHNNPDARNTGRFHYSDGPFYTLEVGVNVTHLCAECVKKLGEIINQEMSGGNQAEA